ARVCERVRPRLGPPPCRVVRVAGGAPMRMLSERAIFALVCLNLALQVFDGVATYVGVHAGMAEGNPLLAWALAQVGPGFALVLFKLQACACLLLLWHVRRNRLAAPALGFSATASVLGSLAPWAAALAASPNPAAADSARSTAGRPSTTPGGTRATRTLRIVVLSLSAALTRVRPSPLCHAAPGVASRPRERRLVGGQVRVAEEDE